MPALRVQIPVRIIIVVVVVVVVVVVITDSSGCLLLRGQLLYRSGVFVVAPGIRQSRACVGFFSVFPRRRGLIRELHVGGSFNEQHGGALTLAAAGLRTRMNNIE